MARVLCIGLPKNDQKKFGAYFQSVGVACEFQPQMDAALEKLPADPPTLVITQKPDKLETLQALGAVLKTNAPATPFLVALTESTSTAALESMNAGAYDCLPRPYSRYGVLAAAKHATLAHGRTLFGAKLTKEKTPWASIAFAAMVLFALTKGALMRWDGPPEPTINLASATLSGIQWDDRSLWVGNWMDSTVTHYTARKGLIAQARTLLSDEIFHMQDSQPILVCNTPEALVTVGFDLKFRSHQRSVGLPTLQTVNAPGTNPTGLAWDGANIWSIDGQNGTIYKHGADLRVLDSIKSLLPNPTGLAWDGTGFWIIGGTPLRAAKLERRGETNVWSGPYKLNNFTPPDVAISGMTVGFGRLWIVSGGTPHMTSRALKDITSQLDDWQ